MSQDSVKFLGVDKSGWPEGEWMTEPDELIWTDKQTALLCTIKRNPTFGHLCGYVAVDNTHAYYEKDYVEVEVGDVHGGLTYSEYSSSQQIGNRRYWVFGFDCSHFDDYCPGLTKYALPFNERGTYRNIEYVKAECALLAKQLKRKTSGT